jgi:hypothetical protein
MRNIFTWLGVVLWAALAFACGSDEEAAQVAEATEVTELTLAELEVRKSEAPPGMTIITRKADFKAFFGQEPPAGLSFNKSWVVHYSMGVQGTGGYIATIPSVQRLGKGATAKLVVHAADEVPGSHCRVTESLTNPQITVTIPKQKKNIAVELDTIQNVRDCSEPDWCAAALCGPGTMCNELEDACVEEAFCPKVRCANGYYCNEDVDACVGRPCDPAGLEGEACPDGMVCENQIACITTPCPAQYACEPAPADPCNGIDWAGTCEGTVLSYCDANELIVVDCDPASCGWRSSQGYYDCL